MEDLFHARCHTVVPPHRFLSEGGAHQHMSASDMISVRALHSSTPTLSERLGVGTCGVTLLPFAETDNRSR